LRVSGGKYGFLLALFEQAFEGRDKVVYSDDNPDVIDIRAPSGDVSLVKYTMHRDICAVRLKYGFRPLAVALQCENAPLTGVALDFGLSPFEPTAGGHLEYNWNINRPVGLALMEPDGADAQIWRAYRDKPKAKFCNFINSNDFVPTTRVRREFCRALMRYKRVDCAGHSMNNTDALFKLQKRYGTRQRAKFAFLSDYKFTIAFENRSADGYLSEKPLVPLAVGSVPIYWGSPQVAEFINPRSFINAADYDSFDELVEHVKRVDCDPDLYQKYRAAPPILPSSRFYEMRRELTPFLERIRAEALRRRCTPPLNISDGWLKWRRYYRIAKMIYANRDLEWRYRQRRATELRRLVGRTLRRRRR